MTFAQLLATAFVIRPIADLTFFTAVINHATFGASFGPFFRAFLAQTRRHYGGDQMTTIDGGDFTEILTKLLRRHSVVVGDMGVSFVSQ